MKNFGDYVSGDALSTLVLTIKDKSTGTALDLTGATVTMPARTLAARQAITATVTLSATPTDGTVTVSNLTNGVTLGARARDRVQAQIKYVIGGNASYSDPFQYDVVVAEDAQ